MSIYDKTTLPSTPTASPQLVPMVERVARAMFAHEHGGDKASIDRGAAAWEHDGNLYLELARAAIAAMREPTDAMVIAGAQHIAGIQHPISDTAGDTKGRWRAMIDAALAEVAP